MDHYLILIDSLNQPLTVFLHTTNDMIYHLMPDNVVDNINMHSSCLIMNQLKHLANDDDNHMFDLLPQTLLLKLEIMQCINATICHDHVH